MALFNNVYDIEDSDLIAVIKGLYITLADVDKTGNTAPLLEAMVKALGYLDETEETVRLKDEIKSWLEGRKLAERDQYADALTEYNKAIALNGENPATLYERARVLTELSQYQQALNDLDQVMAIARQVPAPTPTPSLSTATSIPSSTPTSTSTSTSNTDTTPTKIPSATSLLTSTEIPTPTPIPISITSKFVNASEMINAVRNLIYSNPDLISSLVRASESEYNNLRESGLVPTPTSEPTFNLTSTSPLPAEVSAPTSEPTTLPPPAEVSAPSGIVSLRAGPEDNYETVFALPDGTVLDVLRRVYNKDDWIKVAVNPDTDERIEGYVNIADGFVQVNAKLNEIPPIYEFGPELYEPKNWTSYPVGEENKEFQWQQFVLEPNQYYSVRVVMDLGEGAEPPACVHIQTKEPKAFLKLDCPPESYYWSVVIATSFMDGGELKWREDSERNGKIFFGIGQPHHNTPSDDGGGGDGSGGGGFVD